jgi:hypothetical protein
MKICENCVCDIHRIPFQCGDKIPENGKRNRRLNQGRRTQKYWIVLKRTAFIHRLENRNFEYFFWMDESEE